MKIRTRFTLLISAISLLSAGLVYAFVTAELSEGFFVLIDQEIHDVGTSLLHKTRETPRNSSLSSDYPLDRYWIRLTDNSGAIRFQSRLAKLADLPTDSHRTRFFAKASVPVDAVWIEPEEEDDRKKIDENMWFRVVRLEKKDKAGGTLTITVAKPIPIFSVELQEILVEILLWASLFTAVVIIASYLLAGRMLRPLHSINRLIKEIRESSLYRRIPLDISKDELHTLSTSLNEMFERLQESFEKQKLLISDASHELKSPLTILRLGIEDLLQGQLPEETRKELETQLIIIQRMQKLVTDLLDISRLEQQDTLARQTVDIARLITDVIDEFKGLIDYRQVQVSVDLEQTSIAVDRLKILRLFANLIDNAIKYNVPEGGKLAIRVHRKSDTVEVTIANTGVVLDPHEYQKIFNQFYRVEKSRSQDYGGTGLGLTIARRIVEMHGGTIEVSSDHLWNTFLIRLPASHGITC